MLIPLNSIAIVITEGVWGPYLLSLPSGSTHESFNIDAIDGP